MNTPGPYNIKFKRFLRECNHNEDLLESGERPIYDFYIVIDGEKRAILSVNYRGRGYTLHDLDHRNLGTGTMRGGRPIAECSSQKEFETFTMKWLHTMPTTEEIEAIRFQEEQNKINSENQEKAKIAENRIKDAASDLLEALQEILEGVYFEKQDNDDPRNINSFRQKAQAAIAKATGGSHA